MLLLNKFNRQIARKWDILISQKIKIKSNLVLKLLENSQTEIIDSINDLDNYLNNNCDLTKNEKDFAEDFVIILDIIRTKLNDAIFILKKNELERNPKIVYFEPREIEDIYINPEYRLNNIFKKD